MSEIMKINDINTTFIDKQLSIIEQAIAWGKLYEANTFPFKYFKESRRKLKKIRFALSEHCSAAAYGESQVGKSYLMSALLSTEKKQFRISDGQDGDYSFIDELNPSGGSTATEESTGIVTRFSTKATNVKMAKYVRIGTLSVSDIIMLLADSYYKNVKIDTDSVLSQSTINDKVDTIRSLHVKDAEVQSFITEDDICNMLDKDDGYFRTIIGNSAVNVINSNFCTKIAPIITRIAIEDWGKVFGLLWNENTTLTNLFCKLIGEFNKINFESEVFVPFDAVLKKNGTLLKVNWLDAVCDRTRIPNHALTDTDVYNSDGVCLAQQFSKAFLSALTAELTFLLPPEIVEEKPFLKHFDLLDFPGERRAESVHEKDMDGELANMLRRGKVSYLFHKYSRSLLINSVLFCQHQNMSGQSVIGETLNEWICQNIGETPEKRSKFITSTKRISPFFLICTKFNTDLKWTNETRDSQLSDRWRTRFEQTLQTEVIKPKTYSWFDKYVCTTSGYASDAFQSIYLLRDFFWSRDQNIFAGFKENVSGEIREVVPDSYPDYRKDLKESFLKFPFVQKHFASPEDAWDAAATLNHDGSLEIIRDLNNIAPVIDKARQEKYISEVQEIIDGLQQRLTEYYVPDDEIEKKENTRRISGDLRLTMESLFANDPASIGELMSAFMIQPTLIRQEVYNIVICHTDQPVDRSPINVIWINSGITQSDDKETKLRKLYDYYAINDESKLRTSLNEHGINLDDVLAGIDEIPTTIGELLTKHIYDLWSSHITQAVDSVGKTLKHADRLSFMFDNLFIKLNIKQILLKTINKYIDTFNDKQLPNVISDAASLICNNFISSVGWQYFTEQDKVKIKGIANSLNIDIDIETKTDRPVMPLTDALQAFDDATTIIREMPTDASKVLKKLPWWGNFKRWEDLLIIGLVYTSDIVQCNPQANDALKKIIDEII